MRTPYLFPLLDLPNELIAHIIELIDSRPTLRRLSRTCRRVQQLAEPVLYRYTLLRTGAQTDKFLRSVDSRNDRALALHKLEFPANSNYVQNFRGLSRLLENAINLKEFSFESPKCNNTEFEEEDEYESMFGHLFRPFEAALSTNEGKKPMQRLQKLVMHLNGCESPYWTVEARSLALFQLPSLVYLKLSCVNILDDFATNVERAHFTSLRHLELEESNITHQGLHKLLSLPKALETLSLGENCHNYKNFGVEIDPDCNRLFAKDPAATLAALGQHKDSLKSFTYMTPDIRYPRQVHGAKQTNPSPVDAGFADFVALESITLVNACSNFERAVLSSKPPPGLQQITYKATNLFELHPHRTLLSAQEGDPQHLLTFIPFLRAPSCSIPESLKSLDLIENISRYHRLGISKVIRATSKVAEDMGIKMRVMNVEHSHFYPPLLYGEPVPEESVFFDGRQFVDGDEDGIARENARIRSLMDSIYGPIEDDDDWRMGD